MNTAPKKKLCWNCEGSVSFGETNCPYCGVYLHPDTDSAKEEYSPPYPLAGASVSEAQDEESTNKIQEEGILEPSLTEMRSALLPLCFLMAGVFFALFSFVLYFFSNEGFLTLRWDSQWWFVYLLLSLPMLGFGWIYWRKLDSTD